MFVFYAVLLITLCVFAAIGKYYWNEFHFLTKYECWFEFSLDKSNCIYFSVNVLGWNYVLVIVTTTSEYVVCFEALCVTLYNFVHVSSYSVYLICLKSVLGILEMS